MKAKEIAYQAGCDAGKMCITEHVPNMDKYTESDWEEAVDWYISEFGYAPGEEELVDMEDPEQKAEWIRGFQEEWNKGC